MAGLAQEFLKMLDYTVTAFHTDSTEASMFSEPSPLTLVITDQNMPKLTGLNLARNTKCGATFPSSFAPVIAAAPRRKWQKNRGYESF